MHCVPCGFLPAVSCAWVCAPQHLAAAGGYDDVVRFLILEGADVNGKDNFGTTPLLEALRAGHESTARILVSKKGTVSLKVSRPAACQGCGV